jgi:multidrug efflux system outer membrane protein
MKRASFALVAAVLLSGGCTLIPDYQQPASPVPERIGDAGPGTSQIVLPGWRALFPEPELQQLIQTALSNNRDLRLALLDVASARAQYQIEGAALLPNISVDGSGSRQRTPADLSYQGESTINSQYSAQVGISAYELDLFGRVRSLKQSALESYLATVEAQRAAHITLVSEVASAYLALLADRQRLHIAERTVDAQRQSLRLTEDRFELGLGSGLAVSQARAALETARANHASYQRQVAQDKNALAMIVGAPLPTLNGDALTDPDLAGLPAAPAGLSSELLLQRPDLLQAEHSLKAANANIGAARAAFFPRISLTGAYGSASSELSGLFESGSEAWSFSPTLSLPIFTGGSNKATLDLARVRRDQAVVRYEQTIQTAFREVADALDAVAALTRQEQAQQALKDATERNLVLSEQRYQQGADDYLAVLDARRELLSASQQLVAVTLSRLNNRITLYRALGGGGLADQPTVIGKTTGHGNTGSATNG